MLQKYFRIMFLEVFCSESVNSEQWGDSDSILITHLTLLDYLILFMRDYHLCNTIKTRHTEGTRMGVNQLWILLF